MKSFNTEGRCIPSMHYMVNIEDKLAAIKKMVDDGKYFVINRARQYGKTTTLQLLAEYLKEEYIVISLDFQMLSHAQFTDERSFCMAFVRLFLRRLRITGEEKKLPAELLEELRICVTTADRANLGEVFWALSDLCGAAKQPLVLLIDEVDNASNYQIFIDFLAQLRGYYLKREDSPIFRSVILAGVHDIRNLKAKIRPEMEHKLNSPWNIAAPFDVDMSFSVDKIAGMLTDYEQDHKTGMDVGRLAEEIYAYTSGYPVLTSRLCRLLDEEIVGTVDFPDLSSAWTAKGVRAAVALVLVEKSPLFESLQEKLSAYSELRQFLQGLLMNGREIGYDPDNYAISIALMFGFARVENHRVVVANRIFETRLYNHFLTSQEMQHSEMYTRGAVEKYRFIKGDRLDMRLILERFVATFREVYGDCPKTFLEEEGRRFFLLYLRPIINGMGNYYIEPQTRDRRRMDVVVDYCGVRYVIELKIWHGDAYNAKGEQQLSEYLDRYQLKRGYLLTFNFNQNKEIGVREVPYGDKVLIEAVV